MKRSLTVRTLAFILAGAGLMVLACSREPSDGAADMLGESSVEARNRCGNGRCDRNETCSTCPQDCGVCVDASPSPDSSPPTGICSSTATPPAQYQHVVIFSFENRTWSNVGLGFSPTTMPYLHSLASQCSYFSDWTETNTSQNSLTQYIGETSGVNNTSTVNDCNPSPSCQSTDNNIFRQVRQAGGTARNYVEGATTGCSASGNAAKHIPGLYYFGTYTDGTGTHNDHDFCNTEV